MVVVGNVLGDVSANKFRTDPCNKPGNKLTNSKTLAGNKKTSTGSTLAMTKPQIGNRQQVWQLTLKAIYVNTSANGS